MSQPWSPERVISEREAIELIEKQFAQLKPASLKVLGEGFDNTVFLVNQQYVFRFPRKELAASLIQTENRLLPVIEPLLPIPIPNPKYRGTPEGDYPWPFGGYEILPGKTPAKLTKEQRMLSVKPLAQFLRTLHDFPLIEAKKLQVPYDQIERMNIIKRKPLLEGNIEKARNKDLIDQHTVELLESFLSTIKSPLEDDTKTLVHGDLHIRNMLVNNTGQISAMIDWGDTHIGHPAVDLSIVYSFLPAEGRELFFRLYGDVQLEVKKVARFKAIYSLLVLLLYGEDLMDKGLVEESRSTLLLALEG
ncbi:aminoglycoside phosphotransferase (APT) family kinase protein [Bacillus sp. SORGH_AS 510]|uniref:phosphotransferase n=1 Tax=Bacillus sp. SORGH_AS_0510 TaxID=3041771 RepID=UPI00278A2E90|nr:phosphotransferase [Bacillus sp. SORGH_AS_0510]MDQ1147728.1 aminoglycoside phosphotransferase (APT) family kinase protein [Bacillus sp. SORGH_AS_0510]